MHSIFTIDGIIELLEIVKRYIIYIYPGFITLVIYRFAIYKSVEENKNTVIKSIIISYFYTLPFSLLSKIDPTTFKFVHHITITLIAIAIPILWNIIIRKKWFKTIIRKIGIKTEIYDNLMDIMFNKENGTVWVRAYMDKEKIMYEGSLRHYESDINRQQQVILSGYRMYNYNKNTEKYEKTFDYSNDQKQWVRILEENITRMEFVYQSEH